LLGQPRHPLVSANPLPTGIVYSIAQGFANQEIRASFTQPAAGLRTMIRCGEAPSVIEESSAADWPAFGRPVTVASTGPTPHTRSSSTTSSISVPRAPANPLVWPQTIKPHFWSTRIEARLSLVALAYKGRHFTCRRNSAQAQAAIPFPQCSFPIQYVTCGFPSSSKLPTEPTTRPPERMAFMVTVGSARIRFQCFRMLPSPSGRAR